MTTRTHTQVVKNKAERLLSSQLFKQLSLSCVMKRRLAFTLAEVLICLAIIGVVASLMVLGIQDNPNKQEYVTKLKKNYSALSQAFIMLAQDAGGSIAYDPNISCSDASSGGTCQNEGSAKAINELATKMIGLRVCDSGMNCL
jgi:prepilin-type N-terminal cleavage/methylation domain-containing protein